MSFKDYFNNEVKVRLMKELGLKNIFAVPKVTKIVINMGVGEAATNKNVLEKISEQFGLITSQKPVITLARKSISAFKIRKGAPIGVKVTLHGKRMYDFLEKLVKILLPRIRDFHGVSPKSLDGHGNLNLGVSEQILFPEIDYNKIDRIRGLEVTIVTNAEDNYQGRKLFEALGIPFKDTKTRET